jgi:HEAT repeat protein/VWA domain-containing protein
VRRSFALASMILLLLPWGAGVAAPDKATKEALSRFLRQMKLEDPKARAGAVLEIGKLGTPEVARLLVREVFIKETAGRVIDAAIRALVRHANEEAVSYLVRAGRSGKWRERALILESLASRVDPSPAFDLFLKAAQDRDARVRSMALFGLGASKRAEGLPVLIEALAAEEWQARVAAIEGLRSLGNKGAVKPLIMALRDETGRLRGDIADALEKLTGQKHGTDVDLWIRWLQAEEAGENEPAAQEPKRKPSPMAGEPAERATEAAEPTYYGIKVLSEKVVFVIDLSMSMKEPVEIDKRKLMGETRSRTPREGEKAAPKPKKNRFEDSIKWWKIKCALDLAKAQLVFVIGQLDRRQAFDIIIFSDEAEAWQGRLIPASPMARARAVNYVERLDVIGATNSYGALELAFSLARKGKTPTSRYQTGADTIFFISDGQPSVGKCVDGDDILAEVRSWNRSRKIKIHVVGLNHSVPFLRKLAAQNNGKYKLF